MIDLVDTDQPLRQLEHVVAQRDDDELGVLGALFDVGGDDRDLLGWGWSVRRLLRNLSPVLEAVAAAVKLTFLKSNAASISSMTYNGVGRYTCSAKTNASELRVFSPPLRLPIFFQLFLGGMTLKRMPSLKGSSESTSSSSAFPPSVMSWYMVFRWEEMVWKPVRKVVRRVLRRVVRRVLAVSRVWRAEVREVVRAVRSRARRRYSAMTVRSMEEAVEVFSSRVAMLARRWSLDLSWSSSRV